MLGAVLQADVEDGEVGGGRGPRLTIQFLDPPAVAQHLFPCHLHEASMTTPAPRDKSRRVITPKPGGVRIGSLTPQGFPRGHPLRLQTISDSTDDRCRPPRHPPTLSP
ncbi:hypothetical protein GCM10025883_22820 [Mobilicoccus caccae]|uniref:Uncharacterized protein n=1 Tax=Mobilicoccus caccae TaxID=1859295 RepID=A0ABQ6IU24_9MICO|nr:hypothetical protein GCM10025883_22820 [Mobilicoccus caccae]